MPHCTVEYSTNVADAPDLRAMLLAIHDALAATGLFERAAIKSRAVRRELFVVGDGSPDRAFVAADVAILDGRPAGVRARVAADVLAVLERHFPATAADGRSSVTVRITEMDRASYTRGGGGGGAVAQGTVSSISGRNSP